MTQPDADAPTDPPTESAATDAATPAVEELLAGLADDFSSRFRRGERPSAEQYVAKHPELAVRIREMLTAIALIEESRPFDAKAAGEVPGTVVGRYKLLERIGEGGFGVVFMAEQQFPVRRKVALKLIKAGLDTKQVIARFGAERQALAMMDHPNIAKVLDAGATETGRPYFVMELVAGVPITEYCDRERLTPRERLKLFVQVCHAVQHAHTKGIIHRDLKPTNVLVAVHDGAAVPTVIDFGVAKATGQQPLTDHTLFTQFVQMVGTPLYMSPEQAQQGGIDVDTRSDVYSLGVLLYELLTGTTPFDGKRLREAALEEVRRIIREEEPPRPSTRIGTSAALAAIAANRGLEPKKLGGLVRGELDWIVMKALEKDRLRRYETANGLGNDVERYLHDEPVQACPPSRVYQLRKFARRNRGPVLATAAVALAVVMLAAGLAISNRRIAQALAAKERALTLVEAERSHADITFLRSSTVVRDVLTKAALGSGEWKTMPLPLRERMSEEATKYYQALLQDGSTDPEILWETAVGYRSLGVMRSGMLQREQAVELYRQSVAILDKLVKDHPLSHRSAGKFRRQLGWSQCVLGRTLRDMGRQQEAEGMLSDSVESYEKLTQLTPQNEPLRREMTQACASLTVLRCDLGRLDDARTSYQRMLKIWEPVPAGQALPFDINENIGQTQRYFGTALAKAQKLEEARLVLSQGIASFNRALAEKADAGLSLGALVECHSWLGHVLLASDLPGEAARELRVSANTFHRFTKTELIWARNFVEIIEGQLRASEDLVSIGLREDAQHALQGALTVLESGNVSVTGTPILRSMLAEAHRHASVLLESAGRKEEAERYRRWAAAILAEIANEPATREATTLPFRTR